MVVFGVGQGFGLSTLTNAGMAGVAPHEAGAVGGAVGSGILTTVFAAAGSQTDGARDLLAHQVAAAMTAATVLLALALIIALISRTRATAPAVEESAPSDGEDATSLAQRVLAGHTAAG